MTWAKWYWPIWLIATIVSLMVAEIYSQIVEPPNIDNSFSQWVRSGLHIVQGEHISQWNTTDLLVFCAYISIFVAWLPWHFWFRKF
jgi:hypothetical protein